jgi:phenylpropionate dioxygenase-like ring-hydroxylating dioxygenase large terminal subunit
VLQEVTASSLRAEAFSKPPFVLRDGTTLGDLIDFEKREVSMRVLSDPEIFDIEMERIFARVWQPVAHESEIPEAGDYVTRFLGRDSVIVSRTRSGEIAVMLNSCTHRGMRVCRTDAGNGAKFSCPYHGWTFDQKGSFLGAPLAQEKMHGDIRSKEELSLRQARTAIFGGMIFATFDETAPSLDEHMGHIKWYMNLMFDLTDEGMEVLGPPQRFVVKTNWKCPGEQHAGDGYHVITLHRSMLELFLKDSSVERIDLSHGYDIGWNGHGLRCVDIGKGMKGRESVTSDDPIEILLASRPGGLTPDQIKALRDRLSPDQLSVLAHNPPQVGGMFPNVGAFSTVAPMPDGTLSWKIAWHAFVPRGPGEIEFFNWFMVPKGLDPAMREEMAIASTLGFGVSGIVETDDADTWPSMYESALGYYGQQNKLRYGALTGDHPPEDWPAPGHVFPGISKDDSQWRWWLRWAEFMGGDPFGPDVHDPIPERSW